MTNDQTLPASAAASGHVGTYRLIDRLGAGAHGEVWRAESRDGRIVALKVLKPEVAHDLDLGRRFEREARLGMALVHPNVVRVYDAGRVDGRLYMATELLSGGSVADLLERSGRLPVARALAIAADLLRGLQALADQGLIHRDVKPANLLLDAAGVAKVADFGLARSTGIDRTRFTAEGTIVGSPAYIAPEQINGECEPDIRSDLYATGVVLFELLTGTTPFGEGTVLDILRRHLDQTPPSARARCAEVPPAIDALIAELLRKSPRERPSSPSAVLARILPLLDRSAQATAVVSLQAFPGTLAPGQVDVFPATLPQGGAPGGFFPSTIPQGGAGVFPATVAAGADQGSFPATIPQGALPFPATLPNGALPFPSTIPHHAGAFPATIPHGAVPVASAQPPAGGTITGLMTLAPALPRGPALTLRVAGTPGRRRVKLVIPGPTGTRWLFVYAGERLVTGRDASDLPGMDLCLRCFPAKAMSESSRRLSGKHLQLAIADGRVTVTDLDSSSGTTRDGVRMPPQVAQTITGSAVLRLAEVLELRLHALPAVDARLALDGIGAVADAPSAYLERSDGSEHAYLLLAGAVHLSAEGVPAGHGPLQLIAAGGTLWWRHSDAATVAPLAVGSTLPLGLRSATTTAILPADHKG